MKFRLLKSTILLSAVLALTGCEGFLDPIPRDKYNELIVWENEANANLYLNGFYTYIDKYSIFGTSTFGGINPDGLTDMLKYGSNAAGKGNANLYAYEPTKITPDQNALGVWGSIYEQIRRVNEFIDGLNTYAKFPSESKLRFEGQARFFRAFLYHQIVMRHKTAILLEKPATTNSNPLSTEDQCWDFIEKDLDFAAKNLPATYSNENSGRITKGAALAFKSRVMLYAKRWDKAKTAAQEVIALEDNGMKVYSLNSNYKNAFQSYYAGNKEAIIEFNYAQKTSVVHQYDFNFAPGGDNVGSGADACPTQEMVEEYELATGGKPNWDAWHSSSTATPPYELLEPRFKASVLYNGATWKGRKIETFVGGKDGFMSYGADAYPKGKTTTGYFVRKNLNESHADLVNDKSYQAMIYLRLAEVYLNLAEAAAELGDPTTANNAMNEVRARVNLPGLFLNGNELKEAIRHERKVELAFEGHYYWDLRRWGLAYNKLNNVRFHGLKVTKAGSDISYDYILCDNEDRLFLQKMQNTFPIPTAEIANNPAVQQLEEWR